MGSCVDISRMMLLVTGIAKDWGIDTYQLPVVGCAPEWMSEKAVSIANYVVSTGITARVSRNAIVEARKQGIKVGMLRPITLWPFPKKAFQAAAEKVKCFLSVELNMGQMKEDVELAIRCARPVHLCYRVGGMIQTPDEVLEAIIKANEEGGQA